MSVRPFPLKPACLYSLGQTHASSPCQSLCTSEGGSCSLLCVPFWGDIPGVYQVHASPTLDLSASLSRLSL